MAFGSVSNLFSIQSYIIIMLLRNKRLKKRPVLKRLPFVTAERQAGYFGDFRCYGTSHTNL